MSASDEKVILIYIPDIPYKIHEIYTHNHLILFQCFNLISNSLFVHKFFMGQEITLSQHLDASGSWQQIIDTNIM